MDSPHPPPQASPPSAPRRAGLGWAVVAAALLGMAALGSVDGGSRVCIAGIPLPPLCWWKVTTGVDCAGCGITRSLVEVTHGELARAWVFHPAGPALALLLLLQIPYRLAAARMTRPSARLRHIGRGGVLLLIAVFSVAFANWIVVLGERLAERFP